MTLQTKTILLACMMEKEHEINDLMNGQAQHDSALITHAYDGNSAMNIHPPHFSLATSMQERETFKIKYRLRGIGQWVTHTFHSYTSYTDRFLTQAA